MNDDAKHVSEVILKLAEHREANFKQHEIAKKMKTSQARVSNIETLRWDVRLSTLMRYARAIDKRIRITIEDVP